MYRNVPQGVTHGKDVSPLNASFPPTAEWEEHFLCVQGHCGFGVGGLLAPMVSLDSVTLELCFFLLLWEKGSSSIVLGALKSNSMFLSFGNRLDMLWKVTSICVPLGPVLIFKVFKKNCMLTVLSPKGMVILPQFPHTFSK